LTAFSVVRFRIKPDRETEFLEAHHRVGSEWPDLVRANIIKTGDHRYCIIAEWTDAEAIVTARPMMIDTLNSFRDTLEDLGNGLGVTDPVSGPVVMEIK
jgi:hypothetical protein